MKKKTVEWAIQQARLYGIKNPTEKELSQIIKNTFIGAGMMTSKENKNYRKKHPLVNLKTKIWINTTKH